jgi:iron complex transport system permease protein
VIFYNTMSTKKKLVISFTLLFLLWIVIAGISVFSGTYKANPISAIFSGDELSRTIYFQIRIPRMLMAAIAGGVLAISGASLQALFRNPLACPFTLGVSGGASLGALIAIRLGLAETLLGFSSIEIFAFVFSIFTIFFVYSVSKVRGVVSTGRLLLAGVVANFLYAALVLFIQFFSDFTQSLQTVIRFGKHSFLLFPDA